MFLEFAGEHPVSEFERHAQKFLNTIRTEKAARTVERYLGTLRTFGKWAGIEGALEDYLPPKAAKPQPHPLPEGIEGVKAMLNVAHTQHHKNLVALTGLAGLRVNEAVTLPCRNVDLTERTVLVRGKGDRERVVPLSELVVRTLAPTLLNAHGDALLVPLHERTARKVITRLSERAGLGRPAASHDMRATFATAAYEVSGNLRAVQELLGHADSRTTEIYTGITMQSMRAALPGEDES
jgi:site-specific recombinase XerD